MEQGWGMKERQEGEVRRSYAIFTNTGGPCTFRAIKTYVDGGKGPIGSTVEFDWDDGSCHTGTVVGAWEDRFGNHYAKVVCTVPLTFNMNDLRPKEVTVDSPPSR